MANRKASSINHVTSFLTNHAFLYINVTTASQGTWSRQMKITMTAKNCYWETIGRVSLSMVSSSLLKVMAPSTLAVILSLTMDVTFFCLILMACSDNNMAFLLPSWLEDRIGRLYYPDQ